jgi:hypothetical protein
VNNFVTWLFAGVGVALGSAVPSLFSSMLSWLRRFEERLAERMQPAEHYNSLHLANWEVEVINARENPDDPVVLKVRGDRGTSLVNSVKRTGLVAEPLTSEQQKAMQAATRDYGPSGPGYWRRHAPEWTRRELLMARLLAVSRGTERCMIYGGTIEDTHWVAICNRPRWHRGAHVYERFSSATLTADDPGPPSN